MRYKNGIICLLLPLLCTVSAAAASFFDHFDNNVVEPEWVVSGFATESNSILSLAVGNNIHTQNSYNGNFYCGLRGFYDSRSIGNYSWHTIGYVGIGNLLARNDNTGGGALVIQCYAGGSWVSLAALNTADSQSHDIDIAFEWKPEGLLITLDDLGTSGTDVQTLITDQNLIPPNSGQIWDVANTAMTHGEIWNLDYVYVGLLPPSQWSYWPWDLNRSSRVDLRDFAVFARQWVDMYNEVDLASFTTQWLNCSNPADPCCEEPAKFVNNTLYLPGNVEIQLLINGTQFNGIGTVSIRDIPVRNGQNAWNVAASDRNVTDSTSLYYAGVFLDRVSMHQDGFGADVVTTLDRGNGTTDKLTWIFRTLTDEWDSLNASGFSYSYHFQSAYRRVHKLMETNSFSLNGTVNGCTFAAQRELYNRPGSMAVTIASNTVLAPWSYPTQRVWPESRMAAEDPMDYLSDGTHTFIRYISGMSMVYKNLYRNAGDSEITCKDWHTTALTYNFTSTPMNVHLYDRSGPNAWIQARDHLADVLYASVNLTGYQQDPKPAVNLPTVGELPAPPDNQTLVNWAKNQGVSRVWIWSRWKSDWSMLGGSWLSHAIWELNWADNKYSVSSLADFCTRANAENIETMLWTPGGHLSTQSPPRLANPNWIVYKPDGQPYTYVYTDLGSDDYGKGFGDYMISSLQSRLQEVGFKGVWLDSFQVMGVEAINYHDTLWTPNLAGAVDFVKRAKKELGLVVMAETGFPLAIVSSTSHYKVNDPDVGIAGREWVAYKLNQYHCYKQTDPMRPGYDPVSSTTYFRLLAYKSAIILLQEEWPSINPVGIYANKSYNNALVYMKKCVHLDNGGGVVWYNDDSSRAVVWSFVSGAIDLGKIISSAVDAAWGYSVSFSGTTVSPGAMKVAIVTFQ